MSKNVLEKRLSEILQLLLADAVNGEKLVRRARQVARHLPEAGVTENDIGRDRALASDARPQLAQALEELAIDALPGLPLDGGLAGLALGLHRHHPDLPLAAHGFPGCVVELKQR